ncbi:hypothetical protein PHYBOEH_011239 [Phytophthora boehmeriae]|uniref:O-GlcNAc transferase C-terminal domain-containing protein n=1 Tax=Phytophthora boehmeriae TaxID=109152 RepID=A0A8T1VLC4_9STRA|nr:hypothetical protein PHYBOEH_011239 [Phytophthora boehmeriae]
MRLCWLLVLLGLTGLQLGLCGSPDVDQLWQAADQLWKAEQLESAMQVLLQIEALDPESLPARLGQATIFQYQKQFAFALEILAQLLEQEPHHPLVLERTGEVHLEMHNSAKALEHFQALEKVIDRRNTALVDEVTHRIALAYHRGGNFVMAEQFFQRIVDAGSAYRQALLIDPTQSSARLNFAALHHQYGNVNESIPYYLDVISDPSTPPNIRLMAMANVGAAYENTRDIVSALTWYERGLMASVNVTYHDELSARIDHLHLMVHMVRAKLSACVWANAENEFDMLWGMVTRTQMTTGTIFAFPPFDSLLHPLSTQDRKALAVHFSTSEFGAGAVNERNRLRTNLRVYEKSQADREIRLHIGYLSYDFSDHPTAHLMEGVFATTNQHTTKVVAFGYGRDDGSAFRSRIIQSVEKFVDLSAASFQQSAEVIRGEHIHIVMDAQGHTSRGRMQIVANRPAPIVVNYLVYPGTSGAPFVDYVVIDKYVVPPAELASAFTEKLVVMPHSYQVNYYEQVLASAKEVTRRPDLWRHDDGKQKDHGFTFVNFNKIDKLEVSVFSTWMSILRRVPQSKLLLLDPGQHIQGGGTIEPVTSQEIKRNLWREADAQGVSRARVRFVSRISKIEHLRRHRVGELFLDTFIYGAHSTATDALYAGLPVLTLAGDSFARYKM